MLYSSTCSHLGDVLWCLIALRRIPGPHTLFCPTDYHWQLQDMCENRLITLQPLEQAPADAKNTWIGCQRFSNRGVIWQNNPDVIEFLMRWSNELCRENGIEPQFLNRTDMLGDWPALARESYFGACEVLIVNAQPLSGQIPRYDNAEMNDLIEELAQKYFVVTTNDTPHRTGANLSLSQAGSLARRAKLVIANATGPMWGVHNVWTQDVPKIILADPYVLNYGSEIPHHGLVKLGVRQQLLNDGWLS